MTSITYPVDYTGLSDPDWTQETADLTAFVGQTIQIVWDYEGVSIFSTLNGWLVDDVAVTGVSQGAGGTILVSKNLGQGTFTLTGPVTQSGTAPLTTITNAPPGPYTVQFGDVAFYITPTNQTGTLAGGGTLTFTGDYTFLDLNHNGMSDAWEMYYFGSVSTNRTKFTDTDGDGMSDYAEFIAGTDPTNAASKLIFIPGATSNGQLVNLTDGDRMVEIQWAAVPGRLYQVESSKDLVHWVPVTDWLQSSVSPMSFTTTNSESGSRLYRVQVRP